MVVYRHQAVGVHQCDWVSSRSDLRERTRASRELGWQPKYNFEFVLDLLDAGEEPRSPLARAIGSKGYHAGLFADGTYPIE